MEWKPEYNEYLPEYDMVDGMYEELVVGAIAEKQKFAEEKYKTIA